MAKTLVIGPGAVQLSKFPVPGRPSCPQPQCRLLPGVSHHWTVHSCFPAVEVKMDLHIDMSSQPQDLQHIRTVSHHAALTSSLWAGLKWWYLRDEVRYQPWLSTDSSLLCVGLSSVPGCVLTPHSVSQRAPPSSSEQVGPVCIFCALDPVNKQTNKNA